MIRIPSLTDIRTGLRRRLTGWANVPRLLRSLWRTGPKLASAIALVRLLRALQPPAMLFVGKLIIDEIVLQTQSPSPGPSLSDWIDSGRASALASWIFVEFLLVAGGNALNRLGALAESLISERHGHALGIELVGQAARLDLKDIESSAAQDKLQRANAATMLGNQLLTTLLNQMQSAITLLALLGGLVAFAPWLVLLLLVALLPTFLVEAHFNARQYEAAMALSPERRRLNYFQQVGTAASAAKEVKLFDLGKYVAERLADHDGPPVDRDPAGALEQHLGGRRLARLLWRLCGDRLAGTDWHDQHRRPDLPRGIADAAQRPVRGAGARAGADRLADAIPQ